MQTFLLNPEAIRRPVSFVWIIAYSLLSECYLRSCSIDCSAKKWRQMIFRNKTMIQQLRVTNQSSKAQSISDIFLRTHVLLSSKFHQGGLLRKLFHAAVELDCASCLIIYMQKFIWKGKAAILHELQVTHNYTWIQKSNFRFLDSWSKSLWDLTEKTTFLLFFTKLLRRFGWR